MRAKAMTPLHLRADELERENAELRRRLGERETELAEAQEQQAATAEVLQVINASPGDLVPVFGVILEKALQLCEAKFGSFMISDGTTLTFVAAAGHPEFEAWTRRTGRMPIAGTTLERLLDGVDIVRIPDLADTEAYRSGVPARRALVDIGGFRTLLNLPLRKDDKLLGVLGVYRQEVRPFSEKEIALLRNFAAQAVIAMENARLLGELRQRTEEVAELNRGLEARVAEAVDELGRVGAAQTLPCPSVGRTHRLPRR